MYTHEFNEVVVASGVNSAITGVKASYRTGLTPFCLRAVAVVATAAVTAGAVLSITRTDVGGGSDLLLGTMTLPTMAAGDLVVIEEALISAETRPGQEIQFNVTAAQAGTFDIMGRVDPGRERPENFDNATVVSS